MSFDAVMAGLGGPSVFEYARRSVYVVLSHKATRSPSSSVCQLERVVECDVMSPNRLSPD